MRQEVMRAALCVTMAFGVSGCGSLAERMFEPDGNTSKVTSAGTNPVFDPAEMDKVNLGALLKDNLPKRCTVSPGGKEPTVYDTLKQYRQCATPDEAMQARNSIQDMILGVSDRYCHTYIRLLTKADSDVNFTFGSLTTVLGGLSAIFTDATTARVLGGSAGITGGLNAEFNRAFLRDQMVHVIYSGINMARSEQHRLIEEQQKKSIRDYTVEHAIKDAILYNTACSLPAGLDKVKDVVSNPTPAGLQAAQAIVKDVTRLRAHLDLTTAAQDGDYAKAERARRALNTLEVQGRPDDQETIARWRVVEAAGAVGAAQDRVDQLTKAQADLSSSATDEEKNAMTKALGDATAQLESAKKTLVTARASLAEIEDQVKKANKAKEAPKLKVTPVTVAFSGSKPVLMPDLTAILDAAKAGGKVVITPYTNASNGKYCEERFLAVRQVLAAVPDAGLVHGLCVRGQDGTSADFRKVVVSAE